MATIKFSVIIPVYKNELSIPRLMLALESMSLTLEGEMEAVFVVDGSPDQSYALLRDAMTSCGFPVQLLVHSRNFGSFPAIRTGLLSARGEYYGVMAADLQEPPDLQISFFRALEADECDVVVGARSGRNDPLVSRLTSKAFWTIYRRLVVREIPEGGVDIFGCNSAFRNHLLKLEESRSSLIALIFWLGFRRKTISYQRLERLEGGSSWTMRKKIDYMMDSIFAFTDYPIRLLTKVGVVGMVFASIMGVAVLIASISGHISVPGYAATMLVVLFFGAINIFSLGLVGNYVWRSYENSKQRPLAVVSKKILNDK